jgi:hypothetical protein
MQIFSSCAMVICWQKVQGLDDLWVKGSPSLAYDLKSAKKTTIQNPLLLSRERGHLDRLCGRDTRFPS